VTCTPDESVYVKQLGITTQISHIYNGYAKLSLTELSPQIKEITSTQYIMFLGYLEARKQPDLLIRAFAQARACSNDYKLVLVGPDAYGFQNILDNLVKTLNLRDSVIFTGRVSDYDKWALLQHTTGLFLPSTGEGWPVVLAEAIGAGVPMVVSVGCNFSEIRRLDIGLQIDNFDTKNWADAIDLLCFDKEQQISFRKNLKKCSASFSWENITEQWLEKYNNLVNK
jgi:glycosyltransferase involved in cell wall biosynthesis